MRTLNPTKLAKQVERLIAVKQELNRLTYKRSETDPDALPYRVRRAGRMIVVDHRQSPRGKWVAVYAVSPEGALFQVSFTDPDPTSISRQIRKLENLVAEERAAGQVEWKERQRLDAMARRQVVNFLYEPSWSVLTCFAGRGINIRWKKATTAAGRKEQAELKQRLAHIG